MSPRKSKVFIQLDHDGILPIINNPWCSDVVVSDGVVDGCLFDLVEV